MKTNLISFGIILFSISLTAQVGINTQLPAATLDVNAKTTSTSANIPEGLIAPRLTIADLNAKSAAYGAAQAGTLIYVTNSTDDTPTGQTTNINAPGYYFFDGTIWMKVTTGNSGSGGGNDVYNSDGTLTANRTVALADKTLGFTANPIGGTNHFSVDDNTFSVDAFNNRVGIGTNTPTQKLHIENGNIFMKYDSPTIFLQSTTPRVTSNPDNDNGGLVFYEGPNSTIEGMFIRHINNKSGYFFGNQLQFGSIDNGIYNPILNVANVTKQVLIGTTTVPPIGGSVPYAKLVVSSTVANGAIQIIDGTQSNNKVLTSNASGVGTWKVGSLSAPSTVNVWDNSGSYGSMPDNQNSVVGPYTVDKTGWYQIQSTWNYKQNQAGGTDSGIAYIWMQINTSPNVGMYVINNPTLANQPAEVIVNANRIVPMIMLSGMMIYLSAGQNYYVHLQTFGVDRYPDQKLLLNYVQ